MMIQEKSPATLLLGDFSMYGDFSYAGAGGEHLVYSQAPPSQHSPEYGMPTVVKIHRNELMARSATAMSSAESYNAAAAFADRRNERHDILRSVFRQDVPGQQSYVETRTFTPEQVALLWGSEPPAAVHEGGIFHVVVTNQDAVPEYSEQGVMNLRIPYAERRQPDSAHYAPVNDRWLTRPWEAPTPAEEDDFMSVQRSPWLESLLQESATNAALQTKLQVSVEKKVQYTLRTGEVLDISGKDNMLFTKAGTCVMPDALYPEDRQIALEMAATVYKIQQGTGLRYYDMNALLNGIGYVRTVNFLAARYGLPARIELFSAAPVNLRTWDRVHTMLASLPPLVKVLGPTAVYAE